jgi:ATP-dependent RNA helicase RhlE
MVAEDYIHRVGRTARAKATGDAITFVAADEEKYFSQIERALGRRLDRAKTPELPAVSTTAPMPSGVQRQRTSAPRSTSTGSAGPRRPQPKGPAHPGGSGRPFRPMPTPAGSDRPN